uniref:Aryl-alcohol dehydrogenase-like oxidoreductase n=1 Tax=Mesorhizobium plurifarium TaxID=69974 RepID=I2AWJ6_MESPL|nr:aryl-alcohol dehydrogenase-like oxidoreductase [Mesorhizobium plurifarium]
MQYHELGCVGLRMSVLLGSMSWDEQNTEDKAHAQMAAALGAGINLVDTAEMHPVPSRAETQGFSERYVGTWLRSTRRRQDVALATKVGNTCND